MGEHTPGLIKVLMHAYELVPKGSKRIRRKNPNKRYLVDQLVVDEATEELLVVYSLEGAHENILPRARNIDLFLGSIESQGERKKRFQRVV